MILPAGKKPTIAVLALLALSPFSVFAETQRQMGVHVHGEATLDIVIEGSALSVSFESPAANLVGFEHAPHSEEEKTMVRNTTALLEDIATILDLPASADCRSTESHVDWVQEDGDHDAHEAQHDHDEHEHEKVEGDDHNEHDHEKEEEHDHDKHEHVKEEGHDHEEHGHEGEGDHAEMHAEHLAQCQRIDDIAELSVNLFSHFPSLETVTLQAVVDGRQIHQSLDQENYRVSLDN